MIRQPDTYLNPVFPESFPDPFVLKYCGEYFAYCTGFAKDGLAVGVAHSADLINWQYLGGALEPIAAEPPYYWAPEVVYHNGKFYMYYSCGNETLMEIRVAVSDRPDGGFVDSGHRLTDEEFAIDAHVFTDDDGRRYLFYATDFLSHSHIGTGTVVDRMVSLFELEGKPRPVCRAAYDWQVYDPHRIEKGGVRWHTVEGPTVFKFKRKYFEMFSGGNWQNSSYGVSFAVSDTLDRTDEWQQTIDGVTHLPVLKTIPGRVTGPGHNSAAIGPNGRELFCVYHSWSADERVMAIDRMGFAGDRLFVNGPTYTPQTEPLPSACGSGSEDWKFSGDWSRSEVSMTSRTDSAKAEIVTGGSCFLAEMSFRAAAVAADAEIIFGGAFGELPVFELKISPSTGRIIFTDSITQELQFPDALDFSAFQHLRIEADGHFVRFKLNGVPLGAVSGLELTCDRLAIKTKSAEVEIRGFSLTPGYENLFERSGYSPRDAGWKTIGPAELEVADGELLFSDAAGMSAAAWKGEYARAFEFVANIRSVGPAGDGSEFGFALITNEEITRRYTVGRLQGGPVLSDTLSGTHLPLPSLYREESHRQFRFLRIGPRLRIESEECLIGELELDSKPAIIGILIKGAAVAVEMVRWTPLPYEEVDSD